MSLRSIQAHSSHKILNLTPLGIKPPASSLIYLLAFCWRDSKHSLDFAALYPGYIIEKGLFTCLLNNGVALD